MNNGFRRYKTMIHGAAARTARRRRFQIYAALCAALLLMAGCAGNAAGSDSPATAKDSVELETGSLAPAEGNAEEGSQASPADPDASKAFPAFTATDLDGNTVTESIFQEKDLTVLNIWGTFCGPCIGEMPELGEWAKEMPENVQLVGLIIDIEGEEDTEHRELAVDIMQKAEADFTNLIANDDFYPVLCMVVGVPTTMFVDGNGNIVGEKIIGADVSAYKAFVEDFVNNR